MMLHCEQPKIAYLYNSMEYKNNVYYFRILYFIMANIPNIFLLKKKITEYLPFAENTGLRIKASFMEHYLAIFINS
jgi:hypothetical protein